jgi:hypothetical protein
MPGLEPKLLHFVVVVFPVEDLPLLGPFEDDLPLRRDLLPRCGIQLGLFGEQLLERLAGFLPDSVAIFQAVALRNFSESIRNGMGELIDFVARDSHSTALYLRANSFFTFLNISG